MFEDDTYSYKGWMTSDYFLKRAFGAWIYMICAQLIFVIVIVLIMLIFAALGVFIFALAGGL